jgi:hypothetical protein
MPPGPPFCALTLDSHETPISTSSRTQSINQQILNILHKDKGPIGWAEESYNKRLMRKCMWFMNQRPSANHPLEAFYDSVGD